MSVYDLVTARIVQQLESGVAPWRKPWGGPMRVPRNLSTLKEYRGVNVFLLACQGFDSPFWMTYKQAQGLGGHVRQGEHGSPVVFWKEWETTDRDSGDTTKIPVLRHYTVFHLSQIDGIPEKFIPPARVFDNPNPPIDRCEALVAAMPNPPMIRHDYDSAFYRPSQDVVGMPPRQRFDAVESYYATLYHELTHSTGHVDRLNRPGIADPAQFGSDKYGREELVAEMGAAFLCAESGIETATLDNSASYIDGWLRVIRQDARLVVTAAAQAQKAADYIRGAKGGA
jgi:antirestriction protein ArdC